MRRIMLTAVLLSLIGCAEEPEYKGMSPSLRTMSDHAQARDYYIGVNYKYALDRPSNTPFTPAPEVVIHTPTSAPSGSFTNAAQ